jgi:hypothetical protein
MLEFIDDELLFIKSYLEILYKCFLKHFHMQNTSLTC